MIHEEVQAARLAACHKFPYLSTGIWAMNVIPSSECMSGGTPTMGVDKYWRCYYHPEIVEKWTVPVITAVIYHEVMHLIRRHHRRAEIMMAIPEIANIAMDAEVNDNVRDDCQFYGKDEIEAHLPPSSIYAESIGMEDYLLWEEYYAELIKQKGDDWNSPLEPQFGGSCADGVQREWEHGKPGDPLDGPPLDPDESATSSEDAGVNPSGVDNGRAELIERDIANQTQIAASSKHRGRGFVPDHLKVWSKELLSPKVCWKKELRAQIKSAIAHVNGQTDYTYKRPSRKQDAYGPIIAPAMHSPRARIAIVVDTSGSMLGGELDEAMAEVGGICKEGGATSSDMYLIACDSEASRAQKIISAKHADLTGGGGTDMGIGILSAEKINPAVDICIVLTDGIAPYGDHKPKFKTIIGIVGDYDIETMSSSYPIPSWAKPIIINKER